MASNIAELTSEELKEVQDFLKEKSVDVQIRFAPQLVRRMEDGGLVIDSPHFEVHFVRVVKKESNGESKLETA